MLVPITASFPGEPAERPIRFRREFELPGDVVTAQLRVTALGVYTVSLNGNDIGDEVLAPGWTSYDHRLAVATLDVTSAVRAGANTIGITVAEGWYRGRLGFMGGRREIYGSEIGPLCELVVTHADGSTDEIVTDTAWRAGLGPFLAAGLYDGEVYDARLDDSGWATVGFDDTGWVPVAELAPLDDSRLVAPSSSPVRRIDELAPIAIFDAPSGATLVDFGQNISGRVRITVSGPAGTEITLRHAEVLEHGELGTRPLRGAAATDRYVLAGGGPETYEPTFTMHGFRYAEVTGWPGELRPQGISAIVCHSDLEPRGTFACSNAALNRLHENVRWSMRGNFVSVPTDCPQRDERLGWTGDLAVFAPTAAFLYDCKDFLRSWFDDLTAEYDATGDVPVFVPTIDLGFPSMGPTAVWGDAAVLVPWALWEQFGDLELLRHQYPTMRRYVEQVTRHASENHLWDTGFQFGDWLDPAAPPERPENARTDKYLVATAYHAHTARLAARAAEALGEPDEALRFDALADAVGAAFRHEYVTPSGRMASDAQTAYALALRLDLFETAEQRSRAVRRLSELVTAGEHCIGTGFVGTPLVCDALADGGDLDQAYHLLLQDRCPSWLYPVSMGATTIWERWDSMLPDGSINPGEMTSFNHYALGAVADFLHRVVAGIAPAAPGYRRLTFRPRPGGGLTSASATLRTEQGTAAIEWHREAGLLHVQVTVPDGAAATVDLPGITPTEVGAGVHTYELDHRPAADDPEIPVPPVRFGDVAPESEGSASSD